MTHPVLAELKNWSPRPTVRVGWVVLTVAVLLSYCIAFDASSSSAFLYLVRQWLGPDYQYAFFVPLFSLWLLWTRREMLKTVPDHGTRWGLAFFAVAGLMRLVSVFFAYQELDPFSLVPFLVGLTLFVGGWRALHWAWPSLVFLVFMFPLPGRVQDLLRYQLQYVATWMSVFLLQTMGFAVPDPAGSNVIDLPSGKPLNVEEACSGIRMLMLFITVCVGGAFVIQRPLWQKIVVVASAVPIAILSNVIRITSTGVLQEVLGLSREWTDQVHDFAGYVMMLLALLFVWGEVTLLDKLFLEQPPEGPLDMGRALRPAPQEAGPRRGARRRGPIV